MISKDLIARVCSYADIQGAEANDTGVAGLSVIKSRKPTTLESGFYHPVLCLILQGSKEIQTGTKCVSFSSGESLIVSHDLPIVSRITEADDEVPYLALALPIDIDLVRSLVHEIGEAVIDLEQARTLDVGKADQPMINAIERLFALVDRTQEAKVMAPLILKEIHFRLLLARHGAMLRQLIYNGSNASRISRVIGRIKEDYVNQLTVAELASIAGMSPSSFHQHFKAITSVTPLQYQKDLRLLEAKRLLIDSGCTVSEAAFEVGYQSPTQFSREYSRKFGISPSMDKNS